MRGVLEYKQVSKNPNIVLVTVFYDPCVCFAQNCPFWVYRVSDPTATKVLEGVAIDVKVVPTGGAVPEVRFFLVEFYYAKPFNLSCRLGRRRGGHLHISSQPRGCAQGTERFTGCGARTVDGRQPTLCRERFSRR